jgi:hypothetical protein
LVPNPSFESYTTCPTNYGQINYAMGWDYLQAAQSAEYFNTCSTSSNVSVPKNFLGTNYQLPKMGNAYAGITTITPYNNLRGNICTQLSSNLSINNYYLVKMYAVCVQSYKLASNNLALSFSNTLSYTVAPNTTLNLPMHIYKYGNPILKDTLNWTEVMGIYKATGNEQYIIIGNFKDSLNTKVDTINSTAFSYASYYLIDDVSVEPICTPFWSYRDTTVAIGDSVLIGPAITGLNINWYHASNTFITNAPGIYVKPAQTTTYTAVEDFCGTTYTNSIVVTVLPTGVNELGMTNADLRILPNPANDLLTATSCYDFEKIELLNITGQILLQESVNSKTHQLQLQNFAEGIYFVRVVYLNGLSTVKKVVKQ